MKSNVLSIVLLGILIIKIEASLSPQTNCLFHYGSKLFMLLDLKSKDPYLVETTSGDQIYFNFCDDFTLAQCNQTGDFFGFVIPSPWQQCFPLTSTHSGRFKVTYGYVEGMQSNVLEIAHRKDLNDKSKYEMKMKIICSQKQFQIVHAEIVSNEVEIYIRSVHGCPVYQAPILMNLIDQYELVIAIFAFLVGFLFLFYGRVMIHITAFFSFASILVIYSTFICFWFMEDEIQELYLYLILVVILVSSFAVSYYFVKSCVKFSLFFIGALFGFFAGTFIKAFVLTFIANQAHLLILMNGMMNFITVAIMVLLGSLTFEHKEYVIIYSTTSSGSYLIVRGVSLLIGGFPCEFDLFDMIESKELSSIPLSFFVYLLLIVLLASVGAIYQELKLQKQRNSGASRSSQRSRLQESVSSFLEGNLDQIHQQIERIIDQYRRSESVHSRQNELREQELHHELQNYKRMSDNQQNH